MQYLEAKEGQITNKGQFSPDSKSSSVAYLWAFAQAGCIEQPKLNLDLCALFAAFGMFFYRGGN